jgi:hypothetical protein
MQTKFDNFFNSEDLNLATKNNLIEFKDLEDKALELFAKTDEFNINIDSKQVELLLPLIAMKSQIGKFGEIWSNLNFVSKKDISLKLEPELDILDSINELSPKMLEYFNFKYDILNKNNIIEDEPILDGESIREYFNYQNEKELVEKYIMLMLILYYEELIFGDLCLNTSYINQTKDELETAERDGKVFIPAEEKTYSLEEYEVIAKQELENYKEEEVRLYIEVDKRFEKLLKEVQAVQIDNIL